MSIIDVLKLNEKDPRWLELEICREFQRNKCPRAESECKYSHVPPHITVVDGRVIACYDSIRGRCHRKQPSCKYFHPPPHLAQQLLANGRKYLELKNLIFGQIMAEQQRQHYGQIGQQVNYMGYMGMPRPVMVPGLGVPPPYIYPPPTVLPPSKSPQISPPIATCDTIPYPGMFLYKKSVEYKPALYAPALYAAPGLVTPSATSALGVDLGQVHKIAKGVYGQRVKKY